MTERGTRFSEIDWDSVRETGSLREAGGAERELAEQREAGAQMAGWRLSEGNGDRAGGDKGSDSRIVTERGTNARRPRWLKEEGAVPMEGGPERSPGEQPGRQTLS